MTVAELAYRASSDGMDERNELVMRELPQVYYIAARIRERLPQHVEMEDLVHAGVIGLIEACRSYDSSKNVRFNTFASFRIRGAIMDSLRKLDWGSRTLRKKGRAITSSIAKLASSLGRQPLQEEIAADLQMDLDELLSTLTQLDGLYLLGQQSDSSHDPAEPHDLIDSAPSRGGDNPFELCLEGERKEQVEAREREADSFVLLPRRDDDERDLGSAGNRGVAGLATPFRRDTDVAHHSEPPSRRSSGATGPSAASLSEGGSPAV